jgi:hypothetical protein
MSNEFKSWEEMSALEQAQCTYSDYHKDAYGFRPRGIDTSTWTLEDFDREFAVFARVCEQNRIEREAAEAEAMVKFEARVADLIGSGAGNRETAIRWIHEAEDTNGDDEYLCYCVGLPYGYFRKVA